MITFSTAAEQPKQDMNLPSSKRTYKTRVGGGAVIKNESVEVNYRGSPGCFIAVKRNETKS